MFQHIQSGEVLPCSISKEQYSAVRADTVGYPKWLVGCVGFLASYNGRYFNGGYAGTVKTKSEVIRDYYDEARRNLLSQNLNGIVFDCKDYREHSFENCVIYCDPPYEGVKQYGSAFDHAEFWQTMRVWSQNNIVIISEQNAPDDFECIWEQPVTRTVDNAKRVTVVEKLFMFQTEKTQAVIKA